MLDIYSSPDVYMFRHRPWSMTPNVLVLHLSNALRNREKVDIRSCNAPTQRSEQHFQLVESMYDAF